MKCRNKSTKFMVRKRQSFSAMHISHIKTFRIGVIIVHFN